jgi:hypothetical protein
MVVTAPKEDRSENCTGIRVLEYHGNNGRQKVHREEKELDKDTLCQHKQQAPCQGSS